MKIFTLLLSFTFFCNSGFCQLINVDRTVIYSPAISLENPVGGGEFGQVALGLSYQNKTRIASKDDGSAAVYIGLGEPEKFIGAGVNLNVYGLTNQYGEKNNILEGGLDFHVNKFLFDKKLLLDIGVNNAVVWGGNSYVTYQKSWYMSANYMLILKDENTWTTFSYLSLTGGLGNGYFRNDDNVENNTNSFDPFLSVATPVFKGVNLIMEWNGYDIGAGISMIPLQKIPAMFTLEFTDISYGNPRMVASASFPFNFRKGSRYKQDDVKRPLNTKNIRPVRTI